MKKDMMGDRLKTPNTKLSQRARVDKVIDLINLYHSIDRRSGTTEEKQTARNLIVRNLNELTPFLKSKSLESMIKSSIKSESYWNEVRSSLA